MDRRFIVRPLAEVDLEVAARWYEDERAGLSVRFLSDVDWTITRIRERPFEFPAVSMRRHELVDAYDKGSATSLHVRFAGAVAGLRLIPGGVPTLVDTELDPDQLRPYFASVTEFLITQERVFRALDAANPEREFDLPRQTRDAFDRHLRASANSLARRPSTPQTAEVGANAIANALTGSWDSLMI